MQTTELDPELTQAQAQTLIHPPDFNPFKHDELQRWANPPFLDASFPLLRLWDDKSGSKPSTSDQGRVYIHADSPREPLDTFEKRNKFLTIHADHENWSASTPFTSFARYPSHIERLASKRDESKRGRKRVVAINPNVRIAKGLPFLHMKEEMLRYGVGDPYGLGYEYYEDEYITLWEVTHDEIVGCWYWEDNDRGWYEDVVLPAFLEHDRRFRAATGVGVGLDVFRKAGVPGFV